MNWKQVDKLEFTDKELEIINFYCADEMFRLKKICNPLLAINKVKRMNYDDLYSDALKVLIESVKDYDGEKAKFETYLIGNIKRSFYDWMRDSLRWKRCNLQTDEKGHKKFSENGLPIPIYNLSFDCPTDEGKYLKDIVPDKNSLEYDTEFSPEMKEYLARLSKIQRMIITYLSEGYLPEEIQEILHINDKTYKDNYKTIMDEKNLRIIRVLTVGGR
ncbi:sigma-70 family RNA polymerase sigma factor [Lachnospiraceae bacterium NSJ-171]|nr:sigma-70 family RNA polymerase sigma factor [Lachnospiraceae bacterium NSJ-171]